MTDVIKSISYSQEEILQNIIDLHLDGFAIECDPTYSKGVFYKNGIPRPAFTYDLFPQDSDTMQADCRHLPLDDESITSIMFDPPFIVSKGPSLSEFKEGSNMTSSRFSCFGSVKEMWQMYEDSLREFYRILLPYGVLIFKCQDTVSGGKQWLSSHFITAKAAEIGFYCKDIFILLAKSRLISGKVKKQQHARKFHCYFVIFVKK